MTNDIKGSSHPPQICKVLNPYMKFRHQMPLKGVTSIDFMYLKKAAVNIDKGNWYNLYTYPKSSKTESKLKPGWSSVLAEYISSAIPACNITFRRYKLYTTTKYFAKFWYYCNISRCKLSGKAMVRQKVSNHTR